LGKSRKRKAKLPFWKKIKNPELKHLAEHIGKITDNTTWKDILDVILTGVSAYAAYHAGEVLNANLNERLGMAASGAIAYKLATSGNLIAGASGTALLGAYGLIDVWNPLSDILFGGITEPTKLGGGVVKTAAQTLAMRWYAPKSIIIHKLGLIP